jgi:GT2 family glycosyltransferase
MAPWVSILIVNYNTRDLLAKCLQSIFETKRGLSVEVLIWDNNSSDRSGEMLVNLFPQVKLIAFRQNVGYTRAINALLAAAKGEYFLLLHPDVELLSGSLQAFLHFLSRHRRAGILGGNLYYPDGRPNPCEIMFPGLKRECLSLGLRLMARLPLCDSVSVHRSPLEWSHKRTEPVNWVWNACMMIRRDVFDQIGRFDEGFFVWFADWDFCQRAREAGWGVFYIEDAKVVHHERRSETKVLLDMEETRYKVDGWYSLVGQMQDQNVFLRKHTTILSRLGAKTIAFLEHSVKCSLILGTSMLKKTGKDVGKLQLRTCLEALQSILAG